MVSEEVGGRGSSGPGESDPNVGGPCYFLALAWGSSQGPGSPGAQPPARPGPGLPNAVLTGAEVAAVQMGWGTINSQGAYISMPMHPNPILYANGPPCA